ncbi:MULTISPECIES: hypothetical protein [Clostridioides]|uniref:hypothetical protein n=1 Tax=Clostridioides sp. ZZV14-6387 TaxID=2811497 RepID=UPI0007BB9403|nr:hypothetical protein [Clostridioides sp. ZZV14-6387]CZR95534.1 hypothetical protein CDFC105_60322 [Clostridioides difficile]CZR99900.1 hypothetical protein CDFC105_70083 [Clostridioides difficile]
MAKSYKVVFENKMNMDLFCEGYARAKEMMAERLFNQEIECKITHREKTEEELKADEELKKSEKEVI